MQNSLLKKINNITLIFVLAISFVANTQEIRVIDNKGTIQQIRNNQVTVAAVAPSNPLEGDVWYNTSTTPITVSIWDEPSGQWEALPSGSSTAGWSLTGNTVTSANFLGTLNNQDLVFRTNNIESGRISVFQQSTLFGYQGSAAFQGTAIGREAVVGQNAGVALGFQANSNAQNSIAIGRQASVSGNNAISMGSFANGGFQNSTVIGASATGSANNATVYGFQAIVNANALNSTAIGSNSSISNNAQNSNAFGVNARVNAPGFVQNATAIGSNAEATQSNTVILGNNADVGIATSVPTERLDVNGRLRVRDIQNPTPANANLDILVTTATGVVQKKPFLAAETNNQLTLGANGGVYQGPTVFVGSFIINSTGNTTITGLPFQPSQITFVAHANVEAFGLDNDNQVGNNNSGIANSFGSMNGFARSTGTGVTQGVIYVGGSGNSINDISRYSSNANCIGIRYGNQNGDAVGRTIARLTSFNTNGFTLNVSNRDDDVLVFYTAYR